MSKVQVTVVVEGAEGYDRGPMADKYIVRLKGVPDLHPVDGENIEADGPYLTIKNGGKVIARFKETEVQAWWIEQPRTGR